MKSRGKQYQQCTILRRFYNNRKYCVRLRVHITCFQISTFSAGIKIFNILPPSVKIFKSDKAEFKASLTKFLHLYPFYSVVEFFMCKMTYNTVC